MSLMALVALTIVAAWCLASVLLAFVTGGAIRYREERDRRVRRPVLLRAVH